MKCLFFQIFLMLLSSSAWSQTIINLPVGEKVISILPVMKDIFVVTENKMYQLKHKKLEEVFKFDSQILSAVVSGRYFYFLTKSSYQYFLTNNFASIKKISFDSAISKSLIGLRTDSAKQQAYLITREEGIYSIDNLSMKLIVTSNNVNDALFINSNDYWLATQSGLGHQLGNKYVRYVEESITGSSIPDNMVEHLHLTPDNRLIVQMAEALSVFELAGDKTEGHGADLDFIGQKGNEIYDICGLPKGFTLFATQNGLVLAGKKTLEAEQEIGLKEVFSTKNKKAYRIKPSELGFEKEKSIRISRIVFDGKKSVYLATENAVVIVPLNKIIE